MTPERWARIETIFHDARERADGDRAAFLDRVCGSDVALRLDVESLLAQSRGTLVMPRFAAASNRPAGWRAGMTLGHYQLGALVGAGGMGEVYRALDTKLQREVALKILPASFDGHPDRLARLEREARLLASLNHPGIAAIYGMAEDDFGGRQPAASGLVLELIEGDTLAERLERGPLPLEQGLSIATQIADALVAAHAKGIVHRDLKPANVKITGAGVVKVLDFGIAQATADPALEIDTASRPGIVLGTAAYMSPEQVRGEQVDARADIWAFGCVLFEMLTGRRAFPAASVASVMAAIAATQPDLGALPASTPRALRSLIEDCLQKEASARPADIAAVRRRLDPSPPARRWTILAAAAVVALAVWGFWQWRLSSARRVATRDVNVTEFAALKPEQLTTTRGFSGFLRYSSDGTRMAYSSDESGAMEIYVRGTAPGSTPVQLTRGRRQSVEPAWSPDGRFIAYHEMAGGGIWIVPSRGGEPRKVADAGSSPAWSPDGQRIAFQLAARSELFSFGSTNPQSSIMVVNADGSGPPVPLTTAGHPAGPHGAPAWMPDGRRIVFATSGSDPVQSRAVIALWSVDADGAPGRQPRLVSANEGLSGDFAVAPGGRRLYFKSRSGLWWLPLSDTIEQAGYPQPTGLPLATSPDHL